MRQKRIHLTSEQIYNLVHPLLEKEGGVLVKRIAAEFDKGSGVVPKTMLNVTPSNYLLKAREQGYVNIGNPGDTEKDLCTANGLMLKGTLKLNVIVQRGPRFAEFKSDSVVLEERRHRHSTGLTRNVCDWDELKKSTYEVLGKREIITSQDLAMALKPERPKRQLTPGETTFLMKAKELGFIKVGFEGQPREQIFVSIHERYLARGYKPTLKSGVLIRKGPKFHEFLNYQFDHVGKKRGPARPRKNLDGTCEFKGDFPSHLSALSEGYGAMQVSLAEAKIEIQALTERNKQLVEQLAHKEPQLPIPEKERGWVARVFGINNPDGTPPTPEDV